MSVNLTQGRCNKGGTQPLYIWKYVRGWCERKDWDRHESKLGRNRWSTFQNALKLKCCKQKGQIDSGFRWSHLVHMSCTKHHENITIAILAENCPKTIYNMVAFEFANTVANSNWSLGGWVQNCTTCIWEKAQIIKALSPCNSLWKTTQDSYMAWPILNLGKTWHKQKKGRGVNLQNYHTSIVRGGKVQNKPHHADQ